MIKSEILQRFRQENPEITSNVASDSVLNSWLEMGNLEICTKVRLIRGDTSFTATISQPKYNLSALISKFYDIDEYPGGGVVYNSKRLDLVTIASLDEKRPSWRSATSGTPVDYYRRGQYLNLGRNPDDDKTIQVYTVLVPDAFDNDNKVPFNELSYLEPFHYSLVLYLKKRVFAGKVKKPESTGSAQKEYDEYIDWMKKEVNRGIYTAIQIKPYPNYYGTSRNR